MSQRAVAIAILGILIGVIYTLSPMLVVFSLLMVPLFAWATRDVTDPERRWLLTILVVAIAVRVLAVGGLFAVTSHFSHPFGSFFGDEEYFIKRSWWLRNVALGVPVSTADFIYAFDNYSLTSYLYVLAFLHTVFGPSPYGVHLFSILLFLVAAVMLYRLVRRSFGAPASLLGLSLVLFLPSLFAWSMSALKEPLYFALMSAVVMMAIAAVRTRSWLVRFALIAGASALAWSLDTIREAGLAMAAAGTLGGLLVGAALQRPRVAATLVLAAGAALAVALTLGPVQDRIVSGVHGVAAAHWGHINTAGYVYTNLDGRFYGHRSSLDSMTFREGALFLVRTVTNYVVVPAPWQIQSRAALSFLPEQIVWYALVALAPFGLLAGLRRDRLLASMLFMHAMTAALAVALTSGNVGTLVRHRGLALPYLVWFSALGFCELIARCRKDAHADYR